MSSCECESKNIQLSRIYFSLLYFWGTSRGSGGNFFNFLRFFEKKNPKIPPKIFRFYKKNSTPLEKFLSTSLLYLPSKSELASIFLFFLLCFFQVFLMNYSYWDENEDANGKKIKFKHLMLF